MKKEDLKERFLDSYRDDFSSPSSLFAGLSVHRFYDCAGYSYMDTYDLSTFDGVFDFVLEFTENDIGLDYFEGRLQADGSPVSLYAEDENGDSIADDYSEYFVDQFENYFVRLYELVSTRPSSAVGKFRSVIFYRCDFYKEEV